VGGGARQHAGTLGMHQPCKRRWKGGFAKSDLLYEEAPAAYKNFEA
jgi:hypothetical protein